MKTGFIGKHAKSSAALVSLSIHAVVILIAASFVAVKVIIKDDQGFEAKPVNRPKMQLKKLQVPVNVKKQQKPKPKLRKRLVVKHKLDRKTPEFKMPEITGVKGGLGNASGTGGLGGGGVGFNIPEINIFGVKSRGEKIFLILDSDAHMMYDEMGGMEAYTIIKNELIRIVDELPSTVLFNVAVFQRGDNCQVLFPSLVSASSGNAAIMKEWLDPLNMISKGMDDKDYGTKTLGPGGTAIKEEFNLDPLKSYGYWVNPACFAMKQQADSIYLLTSRWGTLQHRVETKEKDPASKKKVDQLYAKAQKMLDEENKKRKSRGEPPRVLAGKSTIIKAYFPDAKLGAGNVNFEYTPAIMNDVMTTARKKYKPDLPSGLDRLSHSEKYSFNVIHFIPTDGKRDEKSTAKLKKITSLCKGDYQSLAGLEAIKSSIPTEMSN